MDELLAIIIYLRNYIPNLQKIQTIPKHMSTGIIVMYMQHEIFFISIDRTALLARLVAHTTTL